MDLEPLAVEDCYVAVLELISTVKEDQRLYHVIVENDRGSDRRALMLRVDEPGQVIITIILAIHGTRCVLVAAFTLFPSGCCLSRTVATLGEHTVAQLNNRERTLPVFN